MTKHRQSPASLGYLNRRDWLRLTGLGFLGTSMSGWMPALANALAAEPSRRRQCILLWMQGGPSQTDTFDMKPGHTNGGEFEEIATSVPGLRFSEHLPLLAGQADQLAVIRGLSTKEGDHRRGTYLMRTGHTPGGPIRYPTLGSMVSKELGDEEAELPNYVSIVPSTAINPAAFSPGFLGPRYAAATVGERNVYAAAESPATPSEGGFAELGVDYLDLPEGVDDRQTDDRLSLWQSLEDGFVGRRKNASLSAHNTVYRRATRMMKSEAVAAFDLSREPDSVRAAYGSGRFGQGCLIARRLIEHGVPFIEVNLGGFDSGSLGWDTHQNNFATVRSLSRQLDSGWGTLMRELAERGLLETTTILWMGEFGRTPAINQNAGRDHFPAAWTCVLAGGGVKGGQAYGKTSADGMTVEEGKVATGDVLVTLCHALGIDPGRQNTTEMGRPIDIAEGAPISEILA